jgi:Na+-driven multidrug efflux pump
MHAALLTLLVVHSANASLFAWVRLMGLPSSAFVNDLSTFLNAQRCTRTPMVANVLGSVAQVALALVLVDSLGFVGAPLAMSIVEILQGGLFVIA